MGIGAPKVDTHEGTTSGGPNNCFEAPSPHRGSLIPTRLASPHAQQPRLLFVQGREVQNKRASMQVNSDPLSAGADTGSRAR
eukprot:6188203-Pleurochrysis_carterae.AAC.1